MSSAVKFKKHNNLEEDLVTNQNSDNKGRVDVTNLVSRLNQEKKKERNSNIALSVAAVSAVTVFGIILSL